MYILSKEEPNLTKTHCANKDIPYKLHYILFLDIMLLVPCNFIYDSLNIFSPMH